MKSTGLEWALTLLGFAIGVILMVAGIIPSGRAAGAVAFAASAIGYLIGRLISKRRREVSRER